MTFCSHNWIYDLYTVNVRHTISYHFICCDNRIVIIAIYAGQNTVRHKRQNTVANSWNPKYRHNLSLWNWNDIFKIDELRNSIAACLIPVWIKFKVALCGMTKRIAVAFAHLHYLIWLRCNDENMTCMNNIYTILKPFAIGIHGLRIECIVLPKLTRYI